MEELKSFLALKLKHSGQYSLINFYNLMYDAFRLLGYKVDETKYKAIFNPDGTQSELYIWWTCVKDFDKYTQIKIAPFVLLVGMGKTQAQIDGKPVERDKGILELKFTTSIILDRNNTFESNPILRQIRPFYDKFFYKPVLQHIKGVAAEDTYKIDSEIKAFFNMQSFL